MVTLYVYVLDTLADWELGYILPELQSRRFFKKNAPQISIQLVGNSLEPIHTMGGLKLIPTCVVDDMEVSETSGLLLPGADTWQDPMHQGILAKASEFLASGAMVGAICGATMALANQGLLDYRPHTSNGVGFLDMVAAVYQGQCHYIDELAVKDHNLITAGSAGALLWTKHILEYLDVFQSDTLSAWYDYFRTGRAEYFFSLMQTLPSNKEN